LSWLTFAFVDDVKHPSTLLDVHERPAATRRAAHCHAGVWSDHRNLWFLVPAPALEEWLQVRGGVSAYRGPFLLYYLDAVVYPNIPPNLLIAGAVAVCALNLWIYARRLRVQHSLG
jgi:hypothetical protein